MAKQLIEPNLDIVGKLGWCLQYARQVFSAPAVEATAWKAWIATKFKHEDKNFPDVAVPIWFDYYENKKQYGHTAVRLPNGLVYSSPLSSKADRTITTLENIEKKLGAKYVGWSEDISGIKVIDMENKMSKYSVVPVGDDVGMHYRKRMGREATDAEKANKDRKTWAEILDDNVTELLRRLIRAEQNQVPEEFVRVDEEVYVKRKK